MRAAPRGAEAGDLLVDLRAGDAPAGGEGGHAGDGGVQVAEVAGPRGLLRRREAEETLLRLAAHRDADAERARRLLELVGEVGLDVLDALGEAGQAEGPEVDAREEILPEAPR